MTTEAHSRPTDTMRAVLQDAYGTSDVWRVGEIAVPEYSDKEVLVKVEAAALDRGTWHLMTGTALPRASRLRAPQTEEPRARTATSPERSSPSAHQ